jgi:adenine-specific DNA-methyltransferase
LASNKAKTTSAAYEHAEEALLHPDIGTQAQLKKRKPPTTYRYDSSPSPALDWDGQNASGELGEWLLGQIGHASKLDAPHLFEEPRVFGGIQVAGLRSAADRLTAPGNPFLDSAGKAERLSGPSPSRQAGVARCQRPGRREPARLTRERNAWHLRRAPHLR